MATSNIKLTASTQNIKATAGMNYQVKSGMNFVVSGMKVNRTV